MPVLFDPALSAHETVWAAAGTPEAVFPMSPTELRRYAEAERVDATADE